VDGIVNISAATLRLSTPLIIAAMGGVLSYRVGLINIALEGMMLIGAFFAVVIGSASGSTWVGVLAAGVAGAAAATLFAVFVVRLRGNLIVTGLALNFLATGGTAYMLQILFKTRGTLAPTSLEQLPHVDLPVIASIPALGGIVSGHSPLVYLSWLLIPITAIFLYRTVIGGHLRAVGEYAEAARTAGISVEGMQYIALIVGGVLCGLAGAHLAVGDLALFREGMTNGRGFIALAAVYFSAARPGVAAVACLLFGLFDAIQLRLQTTGGIPPQFFQMLPYLMVVGILVIISARKEWRKGW
jgi:ABC-type uncharacterized transport system permease subunit